MRSTYAVLFAPGMAGPKMVYATCVDRVDMGRMDGVEVHVSPLVSVVLDARHFPILFITWYGTPQPETASLAVAWATRNFERAIRDQQGMVLIVDTTHVGRPRADVREIFSGGIKQLQNHSTHRFRGVVAVVRSPFMRAFVATLLLAAGRRLRLNTVESMPDAIALAVQRLEAFGTSTPPELGGRAYRCPWRPSEGPGADGSASG